MAGTIGDDDDIGGISTSGSESSYVAQLGRISGKLLASPLNRNGDDLTFRNGELDPDLFYLDVNNYRVGVNTTPTEALDVNGSAKITGSVIVDGSYARFDNVSINTDNTFSTTVGPIIIAPTGNNAYVNYGKVLTPVFEIKDNYIKSTVLNGNIGLDANAAGRVVFQTTTEIAGNLGVTGNIVSTGTSSTVRIDGAFFIGDSPLDTVIINPDFAQGIIPGDNALYDLGKPTKRWGEIWLDDLTNVAIVSTAALVTSFETLYSGNTITTIQSNETLRVEASTGIVQLEQFSFEENTITNLLSSASVLTHTGNGYLRFDDQNAVVIPVGNTSERPGIEQAETRWNNELGYLECFDGTVWQVATGGGTVVTAAVMEEFSNVYTLIFG